MEMRMKTRGDNNNLNKNTNYSNSIFQNQGRGRQDASPTYSIAQSTLATSKQNKKGSISQNNHSKFNKEDN